MKASIVFLWLGSLLMTAFLFIAFTTSVSEGLNGAEWLVMASCLSTLIGLMLDRKNK